MRRRLGMGMAMALIVATSAWPAVAGFKDDDINIGLDTATNQLAIIWSGEPVELPDIGGPLFGFGADEPGFISIGIPVGGFDPVADGSQLLLEAISFDPALKLWTPGFGSSLHDSGDTFAFEDAPLHQHLFWHIDSTDGGYVAPPGQAEWQATFRVKDSNPNGYLPSEAVTVTFTPEPTSLGLLALGGMLAVWKCRRRGSN